MEAERGFGHKKAAAIVILAVLVILGAGTAFYYTNIVPRNNRETANTEAYYSSLLGNNPTGLQNFFLEDIRSGVNDQITKSSIYFITHRFFDNGGNIYEIYDYINSHPELAFLKEAETIYPITFGQITEKVVPTTFTDRGFYAYLAYLEVLDKYGYADIATLGTLANQYAKFALFTTTLAKEMAPEEGSRHTRYAKPNTERAIRFLDKAKQTVADILDGKITSQEIPERDILVGLNQFGSALRYLEALEVDFASPKPANEIFEFAVEFSHRYVPELIFFTSLLNASTLAWLDSSSPDQIRTALFPILEFDTKKTGLLDTSIVHYIIDARFEPEPVRLRDTNQDLYSKRNILRLAGKVPEFKNWLVYNGWTEDDFK
ncbi:hypothetical protein HYV30_01640 [Candidatus Kaiserbacteria bacterium]|nr:hypothetical protein [Candidatus Kaiserbacteria bacterium]